MKKPKKRWRQWGVPDRVDYQPEHQGRGRPGVAEEGHGEGPRQPRAPNAPVNNQKLKYGGRGQAVKRSPKHVPVMSDAVRHMFLAGWEDTTRRVLVDQTFGTGGHTEHLLQQTVLAGTVVPDVPKNSTPSPTWEDLTGEYRGNPEKQFPDGWCTVFGVDRDHAAKKYMRQVRNKKFCRSRFEFSTGCFSDLAATVAVLQARSTQTRTGVASGVAVVDGDEAEAAGSTSVDGSVDGVLFDVGPSDGQLNDPTKGFRFDASGPLDMRMDRGDDSPQATAAAVLHAMPADTLKHLLITLGEEAPEAAAAIASAIKAHHEESGGPIQTTSELVDVVSKALDTDPALQGRNPAAKLFMALRRVVNREMEELAHGLRQAERVLKPGGRVLVMTFNSLESRVINHFLTSRGLPPALALHHPTSIADLQAGREGGPGLWQQQATAGAAQGKDAEGAPEAAHVWHLVPAKNEVKENPRARYAVLWCLTRGDAPISSDAWQAEADSVHLDELLSAPACAGYVR